MAIVHVVLFKFKADAKPEDVKAVRISNCATSNGLMGHPRDILTGLYSRLVNVSSR